MRIQRLAAGALLACFCALSVAVVHATKNTVRNIRVSVADKKFKVSGVSTVGELQLRIQQKSGIEPIDQGNVMFGTRKLSPTDVLNEVGVSNGSRLNIVSTTNRESEIDSSSNKSSASWDKLVAFAAACFDETRRLGKKRWRNDLPQLLMDLMIMIQKVVRSSIFEEHMADPKELYAQIEKMRQMANNHQLISFMHNVPSSVEDALKDPVTWREFTLLALQDIKQLDLEGPRGQRMLESIKMLDSIGILPRLPLSFYESFMNEPEDEL